MRPIRFGVVADASTTMEGFTSLVRRAEAAGVSTLLLRDHVVEEPFGHQFGPLTAMTIAAATSARLRIGTMVLSNDFRPPVQLAKELATIDQFSGGRLEIGIGAGFLEAEYRPLGIPFQRAGVRVRRLEESVQLLKRLFSGEPVTFTGDHVGVEGFASFPPSCQRPHPPIMIAGSGDRMLALAAREADIVGFQTVTTTSGAVESELANYLPSELERKIAHVRANAGTRFEQLEFSTTLTVEITEDADSVARRHAEARGWRSLGPDQVREMPSFAIGTTNEIVRTLRERREWFGLGYYVVSEAALPQVEPVIEGLAELVPA
jgi:probable F420-dependent oxidoreductase